MNDEYQTQAQWLRHLKTQQFLLKTVAVMAASLPLVIVAIFYFWVNNSC